jgi:hydroxyacylglutathione hydrolase
MALEIEVLKLLKDNFAYILRDEGSMTATVIDPSEAAAVIEFLETKKWTLELVLCTHHHWDHVGGAKELSEKYKCPIWASLFDKPRIEGCSRGLADNEEVEVAGQTMQALMIPGHTLGHQALYFPKRKAVFVGDTLFSLGCGRLFEGTPAQMHSSLKRLSALPPATRVYFGHEYTVANGEFAIRVAPSNALEEYLASAKAEIADGRSTTPSLMGLEKRLNPFVNASLEEFTERRKLKDHF